MTGRAPGRRGNAHPNIVPVRDVRHRRRRAGRGRRVGAPVGAAVRGARAAGAGHRPALRDERRPRRAPRRAAADPGRALRGPHQRDLAGRPRGGRDPGAAPSPTSWRRSTRRRRRPSGMLVDGRAPGARRPPPGRHPAALRADAGRDPDARRRCSASTATRSSPSSATTTRRSPACATAAWCRHRSSSSVHPRSWSRVRGRTSRWRRIVGTCSTARPTAHPAARIIDRKERGPSCT